MTEQPAGPRCGNNPNMQLTPGDRKAVDDFKARLALQADARPYIDSAVWVDGDPLMEVIAVTVYERCETGDGGIVHDDPRTIAAFAAAVARAHAVVPSVPADRAAILREAADALVAVAGQHPEARAVVIHWGDAAALLRTMAQEECDELEAQAHLDELADDLSGMADEAQQPETQAADEPPCTCAAAGDCFAPAGHYADCPQSAAQQPKESEARTVCVCGHTRGEHLIVGGRLLCDECDPDSTSNLVCRGFDAL